MSGFFVKFFVKFTGVEIVLPDETRKEFMKLQQFNAKNISMKPYFSQIENKTLSVDEFENFLSYSVLAETNRVFQILDEKIEKELLSHILILKNIVNGLTGGMINGFGMFVKHFKSIYRISQIIRSVPKHKRLLLYVPQLTLINNFGMMLAINKGDMSKIQPYEFLDARVKFSAFINKDKIVLVERIKDTKNNNEVNRAFGPKSVTCPGNIYTMKFIKSILAFLQSFSIKVEGDAIFEGDRFTNLMNKDKVIVTFTKNQEVDESKWD